MLRKLAFTALILVAVILSLVFPGPFTRWGSFELKALIIPILMVIMFGMGTQLGLRDFREVVRMPKGVLVGVACQFSIMPLVGVALATLSGLPPEIAAGIILVGSSPSGLASNVMTFIAGGNLALSLALTIVATLLAPLLTPTLMKLLADQLVPVDFLAMFWSILKITILPVAAGLIFNHYFHGRFRWLDRAMPLVSMAGIALVITIITAAGRDSLLAIGGILIGVVIAHNLLGYLLGYATATLAGLGRADARTVALEVGMQNSGLASGIALEMGRVATMGLAPAVFGPLMNTTGSLLATYWRGRRRPEYGPIG
jgi:BASS family bile acid:Na+ symporter